MVKLDKCLFENEQDLYLCCAYIPPAGNSFYTHYDCDFFKCLESHLEMFANKGVTCITGDLNARLGTLEDTIINDSLNRKVAENLEHLFIYPNDASLQPRKSKDSNVNSHGRKFVVLCRESGMRVINGRTISDANWELSFQNRQGTSMIDISAIHFSAFNLVNDLTIWDFTEYSDHAPVTLTLKATFTNSPLQCTCTRRTTTSAAWNPEYAQQLYECVG